MLTTDAVVDAADADTALRAATACDLRPRSTPTAACPPTTRCCCWPTARRRDARSRRLRGGGARACAPTWPRQLLADAEGATKQVAIEVGGAATEADAVEVGRAIARSNLLKCALFGNDPNWGRVLAAVGTTRAAFDPDAIDVAMNGVTVCRASAAAADRAAGRPHPAATCTIVVDLHAGGAGATIWTNDLSVAYVHENSAYST